MRLTTLALSATLALALPQAAHAASASADLPSTQAGKEALDILKEAIEVPTVAGRGNVPVLAAKLTKRLTDAGFAPEDISFTPVEGTDTGYYIVRYPGRDRAAKPVVISVHLDVVEAKAEDWERDPFKAIVENGYVYGRGALDNKGDVAMILATVLKLKREGWVPSHDLVLGISGDEETMMATTAKLAQALKNAELVLNGDGGGGELGPDGKPIAYSFQAGEKTYADFKLTVTDAGGHSSRPGSFNAIGDISRALAKVDAYRFPAMLSPLTKAFWEGTAPNAPADVAGAMRAFAANPKDEQAIATLSSHPEYIGLVRTTCVPTMIQGGHAPNALPQSVTANVNCRIFPGTGKAAVMETLKGVIGDDRVSIEETDSGSLEAPESPLLPDVMAAVAKAVHARAPGTAIVPQMSAGASDSIYFRAMGIPAFGVSAVFMSAEDDYSHGLNERLPIATIDPGVKQWEVLLREVLK